MKKILFVVLLVLCGTGIVNAQNSNVYLSNWGKTLSQIKGNFVPNGEKIEGCEGYVNLEERFDFVGLTAHTVTYGFCNEQLSALKIGMFNKDLNAVVEYMTSNYNKPEIAMSNGLVKYQWWSGNLSAVLLYDKNNGKGLDLTFSNKGVATTNNAIAETARKRTSSITQAAPAQPVQQQSQPKPKPQVQPEPEPEPEPEIIEDECLVENLYDGFKCLLWGTPFSDLQAVLTEYKGKSSAKMDDYEMTGDDLVYEGMTTSTTIYSFRNNLLQGATMAMYNKDINKILKLWTANYGDPKVVDGAGFFTNYEWHLEGLLLTITYIKDKADGIGVLAGIVCENDNFKVKRPTISTGQSARSRTRSTTPAVSEEKESKTANSTRSSARDRLRSRTSDDNIDQAEVEAEVEVEEEYIEESAESSSETKSKRELMREKKQRD